MSWDPTIGSFGNILNVKSYKPNREKHDIGRVSAVFRDYAVIDETVIVRLSEEVKLWERYEYKAVEYSDEVDGKSYFWRLSKFVRKIEGGSIDRNFEDNKNVRLDNASFALRREHKPVRKFVQLFNNSSEVLRIKECSITSTSGFIQLDRHQQLFGLKVPEGRTTVNLVIFPKLIGSFVEEITVDFGSFKKKCVVKVEVNANEAVTSARQFNKESREIIPGEVFKLFKKNQIKFEQNKHYLK